MIAPINSHNTAFAGKYSLARKTARNVVNIEKASLKGISKTPMRLAQNNEDLDALPTLSLLTSFATSLFKTWMSIL